MRYCTLCLYPDTKPNLTFNEYGVCSACLNYQARRQIDWNDRANQFVKLISSLGKINDTVYDCIIPVSGGKDSTFQVIKALEYGLNPLAVTATTDDLSLIGRRNLNNISKLGVDHIEVSLNAKARRRINAYTLREVGDISWAEHVSIFTIPIREATQRRIPLVIYGENPQNEYGGPNDDSQQTSTLERGWLQEFGGLLGLRVNDLLDKGVLLENEIYQYKMPIQEEFQPEAIFLGQFFPWDGYKNCEISSQHGFERNPGPVEGCGVSYENLDNHQTGIHDYFKYLKFGFGRATDIACNHIRRGYITREEAKEFIWEFDGRFPRTYLGKPLEDILARIGVDIHEFMQICDKFTNKTLFEARKGPNPRPLLKYHITHA